MKSNSEFRLDFDALISLFDNLKGGVKLSISEEKELLSHCLDLISSLKNDIKLREREIRLTARKDKLQSFPQVNVKQLETKESDIVRRMNLILK